MILVCVKSTDIKEIAEQIANLGNEHAIIMTLQNGVDNEEILADVFGVERVLSVATYVSSQISEHEMIKQDGRVKLVIGVLHESLVPYRDRIAELFNEAHIDTSTKDTIMEQKRKKFLWNATFNPLAALLTAKVGEILDDEEPRKIAEKVYREVILIANINGIPLKKKMFEITFSNVEYARKHKPSMLQDRLRGKKMEIESLLGYLVKKIDDCKLKHQLFKQFIVIFFLLTVKSN
ncbi:ketopantoate reductase family protein [Pueribacillus sp. YX66]|uniref:ketopantoate reductase family protein n=1 Tax=Pueribacillus sp. YX66 TaxID=3229242 RepID=UPI00358D4E3C